MLSRREVLSTLEMLKSEHLDVRTVTLGISLFDCASHDPERFMENIRDKICRLAQGLVTTCNEVGDRYGVPVVNKRIAVSPIAVAACPFGPSEMVHIARTMDGAAQEVEIDFIGGFGALVEKGFTHGDRALIEAIPEALATTERVCASVNVASTLSRDKHGRSLAHGKDRQGSRSTHRKVQRNCMCKALRLCQYPTGCPLHGRGIPWSRRNPTRL